MKRVLILAYYFPPIAASGSLRPAGFCAHLQEHGYLPHVLSTDYGDAHPPISLDPSLENLISPALRVDRLSHINMLKVLLEFRDKLRGRAVGHSGNQTATGKDDRKANNAPSLLSRLKTRILNRLFLVPDHQKPWINAVIKYVDGLPLDERPDIVYATGNPWSALLAGQKVAKRLNIPFVADFRDPWASNPKPAASAELDRWAHKLERQIIESADHIVANTEELKQQFVKDYSGVNGKVSAITNAYNDNLMSVLSGFPASVEHEAHLELCHFGSVYELRKPATLLRVLDELVQQGKIKCGDIKIRFIGNWIVEDGACNRMADKLEAIGLISREPPLAHEAYLKAMMKSQYLLILQQAFPLQIPGKLYEYIATGRPLVVIGGEGATANLINRYGLGFACSDKDAELRETLLKMIVGDIKVAAPDSQTVDLFSYANATKRLALVFDRVLEHKNDSM